MASKKQDRVTVADPVPASSSGVALEEPPTAAAIEHGAADGGAGDDAVAPAPLSNGSPLFRPDRMMESLRYADYDANSGIGELVDNSIQASAHNIWITYKKEKTAGGGKKAKEVIGELAIVDDGVGMTFDVQRRCLTLGESLHAPNPTAPRIGRFGVGMTLGAASLARRVEVFTRTAKEGPFSYTYLDLDLVSRGEQTDIPLPVLAEAPADYAKLLEGSSGTIVVLKECDRLQHSSADETKVISADEQLAGLPHWLGRTYRKFIAGGLNLQVEGKPVYLHDPLYRMSPTVFDVKGGESELKAEYLGTDTIEMEIPGSGGKKANVTITMTLLPYEWRKTWGSGTTSFQKERRIDENEGVSILRADREVLYSTVPFIIGTRGAARFLELDRWWGCEISFPPELDPYFHVRYIKRGAQPVPALRDEIRKVIAPIVKRQRERIMREWKKGEATKRQQEGAFSAAEDAMTSVDMRLRGSRRGSDVSPQEAEQTLERLAEAVVTEKEAPPEAKEEIKAAVKERLESRPYAIVPVRYPANVFFEPNFLPGKVVVELNLNHPFYRQVFEPLCGSLEGEGEFDSDAPAETPEQQRMRDAIMLLLLSYAKAESLFDHPDQAGAFEQLRAQWGLTLGTVVTKMTEGR